MRECPVCGLESGHLKGCSRYTSGVETRLIGRCTVWVVGGAIERFLFLDENDQPWRGRWGESEGYAIVAPYSHTLLEVSAG